MMKVKGTKFNQWLVAVVLVVVALAIIYFTNSNTGNVIVQRQEGGKIPHGGALGDMDNCNPDPGNPGECVYCFTTGSDEDPIDCIDKDGLHPSYHCGWEFTSNGGASASGMICTIADVCSDAMNDAAKQSSEACAKLKPPNCPNYTAIGYKTQGSCTKHYDPTSVETICGAIVNGTCNSNAVDSSTP